MNTQRRHNFAHPEALQLFSDVARWSTSSAKLGKLIGGDFAQAAGGPMTTGHNSHQIGLDGDVRLKFYPIGSTMTDQVRDGFPEVDVATYDVRAKGKTYDLVAEMTPQWKPEYAQLIAQFSSQSKIERIFVSPPIKRELCALFPKYPSWLLKVRPNLGHTAHFHIRLRCPSDAKSCEPQEAVVVDPSDKTGVECGGKRFAYWFETDPAKEGWLKDTIADLKNSPPSNGPTPPPIPRWKKLLPQLPKECKQMVGL